MAKPKLADWQTSRQSPPRATAAPAAPRRARPPQIEALCAEQSVSLIAVPDPKTLGQWAGALRHAA